MANAMKFLARNGGDSFPEDESPVLSFEWACVYAGSGVVVQGSSPFMQLASFVAALSPWQILCDSFPELPQILLVPFERFA